MGDGFFQGVGAGLSGAAQGLQQGDAAFQARQREQNRRDEVAQTADFQERQFAEQQRATGVQETLLRERQETNKLLRGRELDLEGQKIQQRSDLARADRDFRLSQGLKEFAFRSSEAEKGREFSAEQQEAQRAQALRELYLRNQFDISREGRDERRRRSERAEQLLQTLLVNRVNADADLAKAKILFQMHDAANVRDTLTGISSQLRQIRPDLSDDQIREVAAQDLAAASSAIGGVLKEAVTSNNEALVQRALELSNQIPDLIRQGAPEDIARFSASIFDALGGQDETVPGLTEVRTPENTVPAVRTPPVAPAQKTKAAFRAAHSHLDVPAQTMDLVLQKVGGDTLGKKTVRKVAERLSSTMGRNFVTSHGRVIEADGVFDPGQEPIGLVSYAESVAQEPFLSRFPPTLEKIQRATRSFVNEELLAPGADLTSEIDSLVEDGRMSLSDDLADLGTFTQAIVDILERPTTKQKILVRASRLR